MLGRGVLWENGDMKVGGIVREVSFYWWLIGNERWVYVGLSNIVVGGEMNDRFLEEEWYGIRY